MIIANRQHEFDFLANDCWTFFFFFFSLFLFFVCLRVFHQPPSAPSLRGRSNINDPLLTDWGLCIALKKWEKSPWRHRLPCQRFQEGRKKKERKEENSKNIQVDQFIHSWKDSETPSPLFLLFSKKLFDFSSGPRSASFRTPMMWIPNFIYSFAYGRRSI